MDVLAELEGMANNLSSRTDDSISDTDISRWQTLFAYTRTEAIGRIEDYRNDFSRTRLPDELWDRVRQQKESEGYDREAYEYSVTRFRQSQKPSSHSYSSPSPGTFIVQLAGPLTSPLTIKEAAGLTEIPELATGVGESGRAQLFCQIDADTRAKLITWLARHHSGFQPTIVRLAKARKALSAYSTAPMLGVESTLPQYRADLGKLTPVPAQAEYPVWYFFYGTLADPEVLTAQLGLEEPPCFVPGHVKGGQLRTWRGKYKALLDGAEANKVFGSAFLVQSREQEDALRFYETDQYEVVRCRIITERDLRVLNGLTFRFGGAEHELD